MTGAAKKEVASQKPPLVVGRDLSIAAARARAEETRRPSELRLQAVVVKDRDRADGDEYADVPCTD